MTCRLCGARKARRACPALGRDICAVCCGTKRLVEITCSPGCGYLASARHHPPAAVLRQRARDLEFALPMVQHLPERAYRLLRVFEEVVRRHRRAAIPPLVDADVVDAAGALASTLETAVRGIIFEHAAATRPAQRLARDWRDALAALGTETGPGLERDAALALRRLERAGREARAALGGTDTALLDFLARSTPTGDADEALGPDSARPPEAESRIILP